MKQKEKSYEEELKNNIEFQIKESVKSIKQGKVNISK